MDFTGKWKSTLCPKIFGTFTIIIHDLSFESGEMKLTYDKKSIYNPYNEKNIKLEGLYEWPKNEKQYHRIIMRQKNLTVDQYFTLTLKSVDKISWKGFLACVLPIDAVILSDIVCLEKMDSIKDDINNESNDELNISVTI